MPARSKAQQAFMAVCEHEPRHARGQCPKMTKAQLHDFAATPTTGLPDHVLTADDIRDGHRKLRKGRG